jgi:hypothetical protein
MSWPPPSSFLDRANRSRVASRRHDCPAANDSATYRPVIRLRAGLMLPRRADNQGAVSTDRARGLPRSDLVTDEIQRVPWTEKAGCAGVYALHAKTSETTGLAWRAWHFASDSKPMVPEGHFEGQIGACGRLPREHAVDPRPPGRQRGGVSGGDAVAERREQVVEQRDGGVRVECGALPQRFLPPGLEDCGQRSLTICAVSVTPIRSCSSLA